ncbi:MAG TPA: metalloregulator ArsR/SmtB family transcription factor [Pseudothermotoga sp.]|nr:metalloregulator ArsR/SmtB family transcription factor [Pseudothermotoga sp.]HOK83544.1 metalloregulator ArsR/SmtB family transcription factor [Pseudothermotoga sp.]HPP69617.1 metalloregulator ArsR/SmtB family transcription factor [Pseudothermotoga sp.]
MNPEKLLKALACKWRIEIIKQIAEQDLCMCDLEATNHIDMTTISRHIAVLQNAGIVELKREGQRKRILLKDNRVLELINLAEDICKGLQSS